MSPVVAVTLTFAFSVAVAVRAQDIASFEKHTTVKVLPNGLTLIVCERHEAPVFSYYTQVNAGSADDPQGQSGLAHMFEHMAFKGTEQVGTTNYPAEKLALAKVEAAYAAYDAEFRRRVGQDPAKLAQLKKTFDDAQAEAQKYVVPNQFSELVLSNGGVGMNASTAEDTTQFFWSMPSNRLELWAYMESGRLAHPVEREFYKERDVVQEERRMRVDSDPEGRLEEQFLATAFVAQHYRVSGVGWESDISQVSATEADAFHKKYYVPSNIVIAIVGDVNTAEAMPMLTRYFGAIPAGPRPEAAATIEPQQTAERSVIMREATQPLYMEGYHRPDYRDPDDSVYDAISDVLSNGRTGRLYRSLVRDQRIAQTVEGGSGEPGVKYPNLFYFEARPLPGHTNDELAAAIHKELARLQTEDVSDEELQAFKTRERVNTLRGLADNDGLANQLAEYQTLFGDWRQLFRELDQADKVTKADIRRVANEVFVATNRTTGQILFEAPPAASAAGNGGAK